MTELLRYLARGEQDVFVVRQRGREVAGAVGLDQADQVRVATALSEVCRQLLPAAPVATVRFALADAPPALVVTLDAAGQVSTGPDSALAEAVRAASRLLDRADLEPVRGGVMVVLTRRLPPQAIRAGPAQLDRIRAELAGTRPATALDELGVQNQQLIAALEETQEHRNELLRLNAELEETNHGVMALYAQLSEEMEETNRGVVALYAELDERSAQLREANEAKSRFLRNVSHELRAPVTAVIGMLRLLLDPASEPLSGDQVHQLRLVQTSMTDLLALVNELLDLAKAESNRLEPQWGRVDLRTLFNQLRGTLRPLARPGVELVVEEPTGARTIITDEVMLGRILRNLLSNGLKFTERGEVRLSARTVGEESVAFRVSDTGVGIDPADHERVFEEFYQVRRPTQPAVAGTGLGLPYARRLATILGGSLEVDSSLGAGSRFVLTLPVLPSAGPAAPDRAQPGLAAAPGPAAVARGRILVVDDDAAFRYRVRQALVPVAAAVVEAVDGRSALAAIEADRPDAIVLDLRMPGMGGLELLAHLAADGSLRRIPVVVATAAELDDVGRTATGHAVCVLDKATLTDGVLLRVVGAALAGDGSGPAR